MQAWCWILTPTVFLAAEAVTAAAYPGYSYATNYISDLGVPQWSPRALVMNVAWVVSASLFLMAAVLSARRNRTARFVHRRLFVALAVIHAVGLTMAAIVHGGPAVPGHPIGALHAVGAAMAILGGNLAAVVAGLARRRTARRFGGLSLALGSFGIVTLVLLEVGLFLPNGVWERMSVYSIFAWDYLAGVTTLLRRNRV